MALKTASQLFLITSIKYIISQWSARISLVEREQICQSFQSKAVIAVPVSVRSPADRFQV